MSLGGVRDEAEIRGHRRTYIGALPGRLVRALRDAGTMNPVILLDEVDKVGADWRGDPSAALLEVLDPAQNHSFRDHYLDVELDLSRGRSSSRRRTSPTRSPARCSTGWRSSASTATRSTRRPRSRAATSGRGSVERNGLREDEVSIGDDVDPDASSPSTRARPASASSSASSGRSSARRRRRSRPAQVEPPVTVDVDVVRDALGRQKVFQEAAERTAVPGVATGLAVTGTGGDVLFVEATAMDGGDDLVLTGQLGDVMKESARIALSYVRSHAEELGVDRRRSRTARSTCTCRRARSRRTARAPASRWRPRSRRSSSDRPVKHTVGMTGEVTLQGRVLPIGGLKQKVLAAHAAGLTDVIIPERNRADLDDVPADVREAMTFHPVMTLGEVLDLALEPKQNRLACGVGAASRCPRRSPARPTSSGGAGRSRSSGRRPRRAPSASTSSSRRSEAIPPRTLAARLAELEEAGVLERRVFDTRPPRVEYRLTEAGRRLRFVVDALNVWAARPSSA